jgi:hypothetical protein
MFLVLPKRSNRTAVDRLALPELGTFGEPARRRGQLQSRSILLTTPVREGDAMTPEEWDRCNDPMPMLEYLQWEAVPRKLRLLTCACCRGFWDSLSEAGRRSVEVAERFADRQASAGELKAAQGPYYSAVRPDNCANFTARPSQSFRRYVRPAFLHARWSVGQLAADPQAAEAGEVVAQVGLIREVFGNPFRPVTINAVWLAWHDGAARHLAEAIYAERRFGDLPVLADLLEEAGLTDAALLGHLRGPGPHALGCHALDAVLGKS